MYEKNERCRPKLHNLDFKQIRANEGIEKRFTEEGVFGSVMDCNGDKVSGPDGFNMKFVQEFWEILKADLMAVFEEFYSSGSFVKAINATFLVLIPKINGANDIRDFRPINLVGCIYKLISKVLAMRTCWMRLLGKAKMRLWKEDKSSIRCWWLMRLWMTWWDKRRKESSANLTWRRSMIISVGSLLITCFRGSVLVVNGGIGLCLAYLLHHLL